MLKELAVGAAMALAVIGALGTTKECSNPVASRIDTVIIHRNDTIRVVDSVLDVRIKRIKVAPDTVVIATFDTLFQDTGHTDSVKTTVYAERRCLEVVDSLAACQSKLAVDDRAFHQIDTVVVRETAPLKQRLLDAGTGILIGLGLRSLY
jgi:ABC-type lipopolysaccharide export system ATPase subunit